MFWVILLTAAAVSLTRQDKIFWIIAWPGTVMHELLHWTVGFISNGKPTNISLTPTPWPGGYALGYVEFANVTWYNSAPIALAPLLALPVVYWFSFYIPPEITWGTALAVWALASSISQCLPSSQDISLIRKHPWGLVFWIGVVYLLYKNNILFG
jgi:hypothetical protein